MSTFFHQVIDKTSYKKGYKLGTNKNDSPANLLLTSVFEHAQYSSPVSRSFNAENEVIYLDGLIFALKSTLNRDGTTYLDFMSLRNEIEMLPYSRRARISAGYNWGTVVVFIALYLFKAF